MNNLDLEATKKIQLYERSPFLEAEGLESKELHNPLIQNSLEKIEKMDSPRVIKTHLPFEFLPPNLLDICKVIYVARNPKDCCVSWVYFSSYLQGVHFGHPVDNDLIQGELIMKSFIFSTTIQMCS